MSRTEIRRKFDEIVAFAEIERFIDTPVKRYSSGMYVRLAFAVAAHLEPEILIVDEVLAVGDSAFQKKCTGKIQSIATDQNRTVIFVSHNMQAVEYICSRILYLDQGQVAGYGAPPEMIAEYLRKTAVIEEARGPRVLADGLELVDLQLSPNPVTSGSPLTFRIAIKSPVPTKIHDFHMVLNDPTGFRVTMIDLRDSRGPYVLRAGEVATFTGSVARLPLVCGTYGVGGVLRTAHEHEEFQDLYHLEVRPPPPKADLMPSAAKYQGTTVLDYTFERQGFGAGPSR